MPALDARVDTRELVDLLSRDPEWLRRQFDEIVATSFPPEDPPPGPVVTTGTAGAAPSDAVAADGGRAPTGAGTTTAGDRHGHRQRSPPPRPREHSGRPGDEGVRPFS